MKWFSFLGKSRAQRSDSGPDSDAAGRPVARDEARQSSARQAEDEMARQRRVEAKAMLAERLQRLAQSDKISVVDDGLISYAEYQLYLDERWTQGEARQPDHWLDVQFPWGKGAAPAMGVRYQDAVAFCQWLTGRDRDGWRYRLPRTDDAGLDGMSRGVRLELPPGGGYWVMAADGEERLVRASSRECILRGADLAAWIERDLAAGRDLYVESALAQGRELASRLGLDPDLDRAEARDLAGALAEALNRVLDRARETDRRLVEALEQAIDGATRVRYALDGGGTRDLGGVIEHVRQVDGALAVAHYRTNAIPRARALARATSRAVDRAGELYVSVARAGVSDVMRILLLTGNRTSAVDRAHLLAQDVVHDFELAADLAADLEFAHTLSRVREADLAMMLLRACDVSRPFGLDRLLSRETSLGCWDQGKELASQLARVRAVLHDPDLDHAGSHAIDRTQARLLERTLARELDLVRALSRCGELARAQALAHAGDRGRVPETLDVSHALALLVDRDLAGGAMAEWRELSCSLRQFIRFGALARVIELGALLQAPDGWIELSLQARAPSETRRGRLEAQRDAALDVYIQLGILEDRIEGHLPAWEGVRIVRESG